MMILARETLNFLVFQKAVFFLTLAIKIITKAGQANTRIHDQGEFMQGHDLNTGLTKGLSSFPHY